MKILTVLLVVLCLGCQKAPEVSETPAFSVEEDTKMVKAILKKIDQNTSDTSIYVDDVVHMAQGSRAITDKAELRRMLEAEAGYGKTIMTHEIVSLHSYHDMVLTRGRVTGSWHHPENGEVYPFETNNMLTFRRMEDGSLKVWQVIFNRVSLENY